MRVPSLVVLASAVLLGTVSHAAQVPASGPLPLGGQSPPAATTPVVPRAYSGPPLSVQNAVAEALAANAGLSAVEARARMAAARPDVERALMPPMFEAQVFQWPFNTVSPADAQTMFTVTQELPAKSKREARVALAEREAEMAGRQAAVRVRDITAGVKSAYADLWLARTTLRIYDEGLDLLRQVADAAEARYAAGRGAQQDVLKAIVEMARLRESAVTVTEEARVAEARLNTLLGRGADAAVGPLDEPADAPPLLPVSRLLAIARERQPELAVNAAAGAAAEARLAVARTETKPDWVVSGGYMFMPDMVDAWTARVGVTWPTAPWARRRVTAMAEEAAREKEAVAADRRAIESQLGQMVQEAWVKAAAAGERAALVRTSVIPPLEHGLEIARIAYQSDRGTFLDLLDTQRMLLDARLDLSRAIARREAALAQLELAVGADRVELSAGSVLPPPGSASASR